MNARSPEPAEGDHLRGVSTWRDHRTGQGWPNTRNPQSQPSQLHPVAEGVLAQSRRARRSRRICIGVYQTLLNSGDFRPAPWIDWRCIASPPGMRDAAMRAIDWPLGLREERDQVGRHLNSGEDVVLGARTLNLNPCHPVLEGDRAVLRKEVGCRRQHGYQARQRYLETLQHSRGSPTMSNCAWKAGAAQVALNGGPEVRPTRC
jgi:hypothetical protein